MFKGGPLIETGPTHEIAASGMIPQPTVMSAHSFITSSFVAKHVIVSVIVI